MSCKCWTCTNGAKLKAIIDKLPADESDLIRDLFNMYEHEALDHSYYGAIVDGSWPDADEIIARHRAATATNPKPLSV